MWVTKLYLLFVLTFLDWRNQFVPLWLLMISVLGFKPRGFWCAFGRYVYAVAMVTRRMVKPAVLTDLFYSVSQGLWFRVSLHEFTGRPHSRITRTRLVRKLV